MFHYFSLILRLKRPQFAWEHHEYIVEQWMVMGSDDFRCSWDLASVMVCQGLSQYLKTLNMFSHSCVFQFFFSEMAQEASSITVLGFSRFIW